MTAQSKSSNFTRHFLGKFIDRPRHLKEFAVLRLVKKASLSTETWTYGLLRDLEVLGQDAMPRLQCGDLEGSMSDDIRQLGERSALPREGSRVAKLRGILLGITQCQSCQTGRGTSKLIVIVMGSLSERLVANGLACGGRLGLGPWTTVSKGRCYDLEEPDTLEGRWGAHFIKVLSTSTRRSTTRPSNGLSRLRHRDFGCIGRRLCSR